MTKKNEIQLPAIIQSLEVINIDNKNLINQIFIDGLYNDEIVDRVTYLAQNEYKEFEADPIKYTKEIKKLCALVRKSKIFIDDVGKTLVAELKELPKQIDNNRKGIRDKLEDLALEFMKPIVEHEQQEQARIDVIQKRIASYDNLLNIDLSNTATAKVIIAENISKLDLVDISESKYQEFIDNAKEKQIQVRNQLNKMLQDLELREQAEKTAEENRILREQNAMLERERLDAERKKQQELAELNRQMQAKIDQENTDKTKEITRINADIVKPIESISIDVIVKDIAVFLNEKGYPKELIKKLIKDLTSNKIPHVKLIGE